MGDGLTRDARRMFDPYCARQLLEKVLGEVTRLYFERRRLQVDMLLNPKSDLLGQVKDELRLRELTANVDALTGGRFSAGLSGD